MELKINLDHSVGAALEAAAARALENAINKKSERESYPEWMDLKTGAKYANVAYGTFLKFRRMGLSVCEIEGIKRISKKEIDRFLTENSY